MFKIKLERAVSKLFLIKNCYKYLEYIQYIQIFQILERSDAIARGSLFRSRKCCVIADAKWRIVRSQNHSKNEVELLFICSFFWKLSIRV